MLGLLFVSALMLADPASAKTETPPASAQAQAQAGKPAKASAKDPMVCKREAPLGSRLAKSRCAPKSVWDQAQRDSRDAVETIQRRAPPF